MTRPLVAAVVLALAGASGGVAATPHVGVLPADALLDAPFRVHVAGLAPGERVELRLTEPAYPKGMLTARRTLKADGRGVADLREPDLLGLVTRGAGGGPSAPVAPNYDSRITISVAARGKVVATARARRFVREPSVVVHELRPKGTGLYGEYLAPRSATRHTAILLLGGSEGGLASGFAAPLLASHGYPVLRLAYFAAPGLPASLTSIPLEYFERALEWLAQRPGVDPRRTVVVGASRGGELALLLGATYPQLVHAVAAYVPADRVYGSPSDPVASAWTLHGKPDRTGVIPVEKIAGPVFVVGGVQDSLWPSGSAVLAIEERMKAHHRSDVTMLDYRGAGHGVGAIVPNIPTFPDATTRYGTLEFGGSPKADAAARADSWPKLLHFLARLR